MLDNEDKAIKGTFEYAHTESDGNNAKKKNFKIKEKGAENNLGDPHTWPDNIEFDAGKTLKDLEIKIKAIHKQKYDTEPDLSGFACFSFNSPGCSYIWINGRLIYR